MLRINLLPRETLERRRYEGWYPKVLLVFFVLLALILLVYGYLWFSGAKKNADLQLLQEQTQKIQAQADAFGVFEQKEQDLAKRQTVATTALAGRINLGLVAEEVSLVLPDEVWLQTMLIGQVDGLSIDGFTPRSDSHSMDVAYKSVAKTLVRLNELEQVTDVWLTRAANGEYNSFQVSTGQTAEPAPVVGFAIKGKVVPRSDSSGEN